jgi:hypothetical protein
MRRGRPTIIPALIIVVQRTSRRIGTGSGKAAEPHNDPNQPAHVVPTESSVVGFSSASRASMSAV